MSTPKCPLARLLQLILASVVDASQPPGWVRAALLRGLLALSLKALWGCCEEALGSFKPPAGGAAPAS